MSISNQRPVATALIGCGGMGLRHVTAAIEMHKNGCPAIEITAVCDTERHNAEAVADVVNESLGYLPVIYTNTEDVCADSAIEAVDIVLPTWLHHTIAIQALDAGKHVLLEKPLAISVAACTEILLAASRADNRVVAVAENYRRIPSNRAFKALVDSGRLGDPQTMAMQYRCVTSETYQVGDRSISAPSWYRDPDRAGSYQILELGVHEIDLQHYWFGSIKSVTAAALRPFDSKGSTAPANQYVERGTLATLNFESGFISQIAFLTSATQAQCNRQFHGDLGTASSSVWHAWENGRITFENGVTQTIDDWVQTYLKHLSQDDRRRYLPPGSWLQSECSIASEPLTYGVGSALADFASSVRAKHEPEIGAETGRAIIAVCEAIAASIDSGRTVFID